jgi:hypothetical protein
MSGAVQMVRTRVRAVAILAACVMAVFLAGCATTAVAHPKPGAQLVAVPDETGQPVGDASDAFKRYGLSSSAADMKGIADDNPYDVVVSQSPSVGNRVKRGGVVHIVTTAGPPVVVPKVLGMTAADAAGPLASAHFVESDEQLPDQTMVVVKETPAAGSMAPKGSTVSLTFQEPLQVVPRFVGLHTDDLTDAFGTTSFAEADSPADPDSTWHVTKQVPSAGSKARAGSKVTIYWGPPLVIYTVTGNGRTSNVITYIKPGTTDIEQASGARLPWSASFAEPDGDSFENFESVSAQDEWGTSISCSITDDGQVVDRETATGRYAIVQCSNS